ncbi:MAG TPA: hypothetical protein VMD55_01430 [Terracidiphilus sp.]|nr:hypothetical protein [Terracidiphilus sp.]
MTEESHSLENLTDSGLEALLRRALRIILILGGLSALIVWKASGWRNAAMLAVGTAISAASLLEWQRLIRFMNARMDRRQVPRGALVAAVFFVIRLLVFAGVIYGSLKWLRGSVVALLVGLSLAVLATAWEAIRLLRN